MISPEDKVKLLKYLSNPSPDMPAWVTILLRHFIKENDENERRLIELDEALAETVMRYEEQISYMQVLLANSGWHQNEEGEWVCEPAGTGFQDP